MRTPDFEELLLPILCSRLLKIALASYKFSLTIPVRISHVSFPKTGDSMYKLWRDDEGQDIAEYAVMLAVILVLVVGTIRLVGSNANTVFSQAASSIQ
jgi:Flp pilus assembly pilin Flp